MTRRAIITIGGLVQGVFFRSGIKQEADQLGLTGFVRNEPDGTVLVVAEGQENQLQKLVDWCRKGTEWARVDGVDVAWEDATGEFSDLVI